MNKNTTGLIPKKIFSTVVNLILIGVAAINVFPIIWMIYTSFKTEKEYVNNVIALPQQLSFSNFVQAIDQGQILSGFLNSLFTSVISVISIVMLALLMGYVISRFQFKGRALIYALFLGGMLIPLHSLLIPLFLEFKTLNLLNTRYTLIMPYIAFGLPTALFLMENFVRQIPLEVEEAAVIDGCGFFTRLMRVVFPMCKPVIYTIIVMAFLDCWNEFSFSLILVNSEHLKTLQVRLAAFSGFRVVNYPLLMAALVVATLPVLGLYFALHDKIIEGMTAGAVKG